MHKQGQITMKFGISEEDQADRVEVECEGTMDAPYLLLLGIRALIGQIADWLKKHELTGRGVDVELKALYNSLEELENVVDRWLWEGVNDVDLAA